MSEAAVIGDVVDRCVEDEMRQSYLDYAMSVIVDRALPDARDGLKPVHRRVLYAMREMGVDWNKPYKKSARIVGDVIGKYHPHGDSAVYETLVRMAQDFSLLHPLIDGQGNFGSVDGDSPAAMRYTEARLSRIAGDLLADMDKNTVDFIPNYDETEREPQVLPAAFPNLIVNGSEGIAVGMATRIPPHNLGEAIDACLAIIDDPDADPLAEILAPDFPTGGIILGRSGAVQAYRTGRGRITIRARCEIVDEGKRRVIIVTELPYQVNKARLIERIAEMVKEKRLEGISDLRDESDKSGMRIRIEVQSAANADVVLNNLYQHTDLQTHFGMNMVALDHGAPRTLTLRDMLRIFVDHRREVVTRRSAFEKKKAQDRSHILEGMLVALDNLDAMIHLIRNAQTSAQAKAEMISRDWSGMSVHQINPISANEGHPYRLTDTQAQAILDLRLHRLTGLERNKISSEFADLLREIERLEGILENDETLMAVIRSELEMIKNTYAVPRRTTIGEEGITMETEDLIPNTEIAITMSHAGYIKAQPVEEFRAQGRGGRGKQATGLRDGDFVERLFMSSTHARILFFSDIGRVYARKGYEIPMAARTARGKTIQSILPLAEGERITAMLTFDAGIDDETSSIALLTRNGIGKRMPVSSLVKFRQSGTTAIGMSDADSLVGAFQTNGDAQILLLTRKGKAILFKEDDIREMGKQARGVRAARLAEDDCVVAAMPVSEQDSVLIVSETGLGKVTSVADYRLTARGGKGVIAAKVEKSGHIAGGVVVGSESNDVLILSHRGVMVRFGAYSVRETGRTAKGVRLILLDDGDAVASVELVPVSDADSEIQGD
jgi:DNA gyrase subunit A